jgi:GAF domain-containing protein
MKVQTKRFHNLKAFDHYIVHKGTIITIDEVLKEEDLNRQREEMPFLSDMVFAPFETKGEVCGLLGISRDFPEFSNFELEMFCSVGSQAATALKNAHVYKKLYDAFLRTTESLVRIINSRASHIDGHA